MFHSAKKHIKKLPSVKGREQKFASLYHLLLHTDICASVNGENRHDLLDAAFGLRLRSDIQHVCNTAGLTLSPARCEVPHKPTVSVAVFSTGCFLVFIQYKHIGRELQWIMCTKRSMKLWVTYANVVCAPKSGKFFVKIQVLSVDTAENLLQY